MILKIFLLLYFAMAYNNCVFLAQNCLNDLLESSTSSSEGEEYSILFTRREERTHVKDFVVDVVHAYTDTEFKDNFRLNRESANYLIEKYSSSLCHLKRTYKGGRAEFSPETQMLMFLWFCSNKTTIREVGNLFNMSLSSVHKLFNQVLTFIVDEIAPEEICFPQNASAKEEIANQFENISGFPYVLGCIDGSYIAVRTPKNKIRSTYINRHDSISITMQGICDANLRFLDVFTGVPSKMHDSRVLKLSFIGKELPNLCLPDYHLLGDSAYPLRIYLLTPYRDYGNLTESERKYNFMFCQTRVKIENAFGLLKCRFRQLMRLDFHEVETMGKFIIACSALHNLCIRKNEVLEDQEECFERGSNITHVVNEHVSEAMLTELGEIKREQIKAFLNTN